MNSIFQHWKTSLAGVASAAMNMYVNGVGWKQIVVSAILALFGLSASDGDKTLTKG